MTKILIDIDIWFIFNTTPKLANIKYKLMTIVKQVNQDAPQGSCQPIFKCNLSPTQHRFSDNKSREKTKKSGGLGGLKTNLGML